MQNRIWLLMLGVGLVSGQAVDDFQCPDEFEGFYPHLISCDKYWHCKEGRAELKLCGNGLAFMDTDPTFTLEQCAELHLVECGARTELEPPISTEYCPRLYGTFEDPVSCHVFWKCLDGKANRYECPPGLAYDPFSRGCKWADQVPGCKNVVIEVEGSEEEFQCPTRGAVGAFTKHAHPTDCRQYFVCIGGVPREYGCPLGTVFSIGSDDFSGKCTEPENVLECKDYYGDLEFDKNTLTRAGADTGRVQERSRSSSSSSVPNRNSINREVNTPVRPKTESVKRRPAPPSLQAIVDSNEKEAVKEEAPEPARTQFRPRPRPSRIRPSPLDREPEQPASREPDVSRLEVVTDRPRTTFPRRPEPTQTERPTTVAREPISQSTFASTSRPFTAVFSDPTTTVTRAPSTQAPIAPVSSQTEVVPLDGGEGLPDPVKAAPGPNGEEYYYYYYYYDEDEEESQ